MVAGGREHTHRFRVGIADPGHFMKDAADPKLTGRGLVAVIETL